MKFGLVIQEQANLVPSLAHTYVAYATLKAIIYDELVAAGSDPAKQQAAGDKFFKLLNRDLKKVIKFLRFGVKDVTSRISEITELVKRQEAVPAGTPHDKVLYQRTKDELTDLQTDLAYLKTYTFINREGFRKIVKKLVKVAGRIPVSFPESVSFMTRVYEHPEMQDKALRDLDPAMEDLRARLKVVKSCILTEDTLNQVFVRKTRKFFVRLDDLPRVRKIIEQNLTQYVFQGSPENARTTSIYYDTPNLEMYHRRFMRYDRATLVRFRWYVGWGKSKVFVEKKTHFEGDLPSRKERTGMGHRRINKMLVGKAQVEEGTEDPLALEIIPFVTRPLGSGLEPKIRVAYNRLAWQVSPEDDTVRISLDTNLEMSAVLPNRSQLQYMKNSRETYHFPCAVLEVKLQVSCPGWLQELQDSKTLVDAYRFSKYCHGVLMMNQHRLHYLNLDIPDYLRRKLGTPIEETIEPPVLSDETIRLARAASASNKKRGSVLGSLFRRNSSPKQGKQSKQRRPSAGKGKGKATASAASARAPSTVAGVRKSLGDMYPIDLGDDHPGAFDDNIAIPDDVREELVKVQKAEKRRRSGVSHTMLTGLGLGVNVMHDDLSQLSPKALKLLKKEIKSRDYTRTEYSAFDWLDLALPVKSRNANAASNKWRKAQKRDREHNPFILDTMYPLPADAKPGIKLPSVLYSKAATQAMEAAAATAAVIDPGAITSLDTTTPSAVMAARGPVVHGTQTRKASQRLVVEVGSQRAQRSASRHSSKSRRRHGSSSKGSRNKDGSGSSSRRSTSKRSTGRGKDAGDGPASGSRQRVSAAAASQIGA